MAALPGEIIVGDGVGRDLGIERSFQPAVDAD
jgi:hypothetical protein